MLPILGALVPLLGTVIDRVIPDTAERERVKMEIAAQTAQAEIELAKAQIGLATEDAKSGKGGFRDWAGKLCILSLGYAWIAHPVLSWLGNMAGITPPPNVAVDAQYAMLTGMLGLAGVRSFDLAKGTRA